MLTRLPRQFNGGKINGASTAGYPHAKGCFKKPTLSAEEPTRRMETAEEEKTDEQFVGLEQRNS